MEKKEIERNINIALGKEKAEFVFKNGKYLNVFSQEFLSGDIAVDNGRIVAVGNYSGKSEVDVAGKWIVPAFFDAHLHFESSFLTPQVFCDAASQRGTTTIVTDPHEIANVLGEEGIEFMIKNTEDANVDVFFMVPSCVPCCSFDESGAEINSGQVAKFLENERVLGLAEMMNYVGVVNLDNEVLEKIYQTHKAEKIVDGHAPLLSGDMLKAYVSAGIKSDHECTNFEEGLEKIRLGQWIMIREGTACHDLQPLITLLKDSTYQRCLFCCDDKHPNDLLENGHIDNIIRKAIKLGVDPVKAYTVASYNACQYFNIKDKGSISGGQVADLVVLDDLKKVKINSVYKNGRLLKSKMFSKTKTAKPKNTINFASLKAKIFKLEKAKIIGLVKKKIITTDNGFCDGVCVKKDIIKVAVIERHKKTGHIGKCYLQGYGLKSGAIAISTAHDSHNVIVVGVSDEDMLTAVQNLKKIGGGISIVKNGEALSNFAMPIAGLMSNLSVEEVATSISSLKKLARELGVHKDVDPFMSLSFISLAVIPHIKLTTLGVVDVNKFEIIE